MQISTRDLKTEKNAMWWRSVLKVYTSVNEHLDWCTRMTSLIKMSRELLEMIFKTKRFRDQHKPSNVFPVRRLPTDRIKAEMDLKELSETVQQQQQQQPSGASVLLSSAKRPLRSLDKTIESCKAQLGKH